MVIILRPQDDAKVTLEKISEFLAARGMNVSEKKTKITAATDGFDFLGWHFKVQKNGRYFEQFSRKRSLELENWRSHQNWLC
jgi:RNA-directed DNA polymerase